MPYFLPSRIPYKTMAFNTLQQLEINRVLEGILDRHLSKSKSVAMFLCSKLPTMPSDV